MVRPLLQNRRQNPKRAVRPSGDVAGSDTEIGGLTSDEEERGPTLRARRQGQRRPFRFPEEADLETRIEWP